MKCLSFLLTPVLFLWSLSSYSQKVLKEATVVSSLTSFNEGGKNISTTNLTSHLKNDKLFIESATSGNKTKIYIDKTTGKSVSLFDIKGEKIGFFVYDTTDKTNILDHVQVEIVRDSVKQINGFNCQLAYLKYEPPILLNTAKIWFDPSFRFFDKTMGLNVPGVEKIEGAIIWLESISRSITTIYEVSKVENTALPEKTFEIDPAYKIMPYGQFNDEIKKLSK